jgi:hypothetical protein
VIRDLKEGFAMWRGRVVERSGRPFDSAAEAKRLADEGRLVEGKPRPCVVCGSNGVPEDGIGRCVMCSVEGHQPKRFTYADGQEVRVGDWYTSTVRPGNGLQVVAISRAGVCNTRDYSLDIPAGRAKLIARGEVGKPMEAVAELASGPALDRCGEMVGVRRASCEPDVDYRERIIDQLNPGAVLAKAGRAVAGACHVPVDMLMPPKPEPLTYEAFDALVRQLAAAAAPRCTVKTDVNATHYTVWLDLLGIRETRQFLRSNEYEMSERCVRLEVVGDGHELEGALAGMIRRLGEREAGVGKL